MTTVTSDDLSKQRGKNDSIGIQLQRFFSKVSLRRRLAGTLALALIILCSAFRRNVRRAKHNITPNPQTVTQKSSQTQQQESIQHAAAWKPGLLDIHHLQVGSSVSTFCVMPDGTTMLIDAGDVNVEFSLKDWSKMGHPFDKLQLKPPFPNDSKTPVEWIVDYMKEFWPNGFHEPVLDYLLVTHFHSDHIGDGNDDGQRRKTDPQHGYVMSGIPELHSRLPINTIIDRGYTVPVDLKSLHDKTIDNYLHFAKDSHIPFQQFQVGSTSQIAPRKNKETLDFKIQVIKSGVDVLGADGKVQQIPTDKLLSRGNGHGNENTMSAAFVIQYGCFRYYEGADQEIVRDDEGNVIFDTIGPTARAAGKVDVATLNHHGHGVSEDYIKYLDPPTMILQGWSSDQPPKKSMEMLYNSKKSNNKTRQIFATDIFQERLDELGPTLSSMFQSTSGHVLVRVHPPETKQLRGSRNDRRQRYEIIVLDGDRQVKKHMDVFKNPCSG
ncbi:Inherit from NOG: competence protein ComEC [Seminavis robusta]|uniref:Inherit from NOG: competence protein ComEC n=1 Tax=Seminavis robusta TaxID=568900 RepID=A0A9N8EXE4_9STRA|nr:Inherit from NOG: competence protein ComEC [Seminavis robusta]|eukprot:Sro2150_g316690.1 Inherit from NOG: competence protein ComEC (494) ;mRNA; r:11452-12933